MDQFPQLQRSSGFKNFQPIGDLTRYSWEYPIPDKKASTIQKTVDLWIRDAENKADAKAKYFRTDGEGEYKKELNNHMQSLGITHETTTPYSPQQNSVAERLDRALNRKRNAALPSSSVLGSVPYELFFRYESRYFDNVASYELRRHRR